MKCSIIGYGKMGKIREESILKNGGEIINIYDPLTGGDKDKVFGDNSEVLFICTPNNFNVDYTIRGISSGKHVFCEKPPAMTVEQMNKVIISESLYDKKICYGFNHRHHTSIIKMKEIIDNGSLGNVIWMRGRYGKNVDESHFDNWRFDYNKSGGGILMDQGIHMLDLFYHLGGDFDIIKSSVSNKFWNIPSVEDNVFAILENSKTGVSASLHSTMTQWRHIFSLEVFLDGGYLVLNGLKTPSGQYGDEILTISDKVNKGGSRSEELNIKYSVDESWDREVGEFFDCIRDNRDITMGNTKDALNIMTMIDIIYKNGKNELDK